MERRNVLLGSGAALATLLAGCSSEETSDESGSNTDGSESSTNGDNGDTGDNGETDEKEKADEKEKTDEKGKDDKKHDDVPGYDTDKLELNGDYVSISALKRKDDTLVITVDSETAEKEKLYADFETLADDLDYGLVDHEVFADSIETIELFITHSGETIAAYSIDVAWLVDYHEGKLSKAEIESKLKTAEM
ncbi:hypothetical protein [Natronorubrum sulfidifaciens]|uniref:Lipoprotein n=1 Tax=Natronorubrum sulfidifaciens JCM 14089 TaxID=1230460 RepID=L9WGY4_9EURY|nr:hypothetical protein [Natronorubrum sulfidifaciens]ELY47588.1 hypothetical protein C495_04992 [Natronorubrum sulfidifaciens JCM 14089]